MIRKIIHIDDEKCNGCGACANACHEGAIGMVDGKAKLLRDDYCDGLGDCLPACPTGAITFVEREAAAYDEQAVMKNKKALYEAALTGKERAEREKAAADRQYQLGLLGNSEYEALQMSYISGIASYELAKLNLFSSINTYKWAVDGVVTLE